MKEKIIDLTHPIYEGMMIFPVSWHPATKVEQLGRHGIENRETRKVTIGTHCGTHIDAPRHFIPNGDTLDEISLDVLVGSAHMIDFSAAAPHQQMEIKDFKDQLGNERPRRLVLRFDWSDHWGTMNFYNDQPYISEDAGQWLVDRGVKLLAMDTPQVDNPEHGRNGPKDSPLHKLMLGKGVIFLESLTNLKLISKNVFELIALPLPIRCSDGAPCRAIAIEKT